MRELAVLLLLCSCSARGSLPEAAPAAAWPSSDDPTLTETTAGCSALPREIGRITHDELDEISGLVESRHADGIFFTHNDSGDDARFFAIDRRGRVLAELLLDTVPTFVDAEDITIGPAPGGGSFIYVGDSGNNFASWGIGIPRRKAVVYRVPEPHVPRTSHHAQLSVPGVTPIVFTFPDGARDVEAMFLDPISGNLILISKQPDGHSQVLAASAAMLDAGGGELELLGRLRFGRAPLSGNPMPTAASISRDGRAILIRTYSSVFLFRRDAAEPIMSALGRAPRVLPSPRERQGEAISFALGDTAYVTLSEGAGSALNCATVHP